MANYLKPGMTPQQKPWTDPRSKHVSAAGNAFVDLPSWSITALQVFGIVYMFSVVALCLHYSPNNLAVAGSDLVLIYAIFFPIFHYRSEFGLCHPLIIRAGFGITSLVVRSTLTMISGLDSQAALTGSPEDINALYALSNVLSALGLFAMYSGYFLGPKLRVPRLMLTPSGNRFLPLILCGSALVGILGLYFVGEFAGGWKWMLSNLARGSRGRFSETEVKGIGQVVILVYFATSAALLAIGSLRNLLTKPWVWILVMVGLCAPFMIGGGRASIVYAAILFLLVWSLQTKIVSMVRWGGLLFLIVVFFGVVGQFRVENARSAGDQLDFGFLSGRSLGGMLETSMEEINSRSARTSSTLPILAEVPGKVKLLWGQGYLSYLYVFIPRQLWPDKPRGMSNRAGEIFLGVEWGIPPGALGEAYWNFHVPGVVGVFFLSGVLLNWLGRLLLQESESPFIKVFYVVTIYLLLPPTNDTFVQWILYMAPLTLIAYACGLLRRRPGPL